MKTANVQFKMRRVIMLLAVCGLLAAASAQTTLPNNAVVSGLSGAKGSQKFYKITVPPSQSLLTISISGGSGDCDLYVKRVSTPSLSSWDYRPYLPGNNETVTVNNPAAGDWFIMLNGYVAYSGVMLRAGYMAYPTVATPTFSQSPGTFNNPVTVSVGCATSGATIRYTTNGNDPTSSSSVYGGPLTFTSTTTLKARAFRSGMTDSGVATATYTINCIIITPLQNNVPVNNLSGAQGSQAYYKISVPAGQGQLQISISGGSGDCDLYVQYGSLPTTSSWFQPNGRPYLSGNNETVTITNPAAGDWFIMLRGHTAFSGVTQRAKYGNIVRITSFAVPDDTWGQYNPDYCGSDGAINQILCWSPESKGGSCYAIAMMELRWFEIRQAFSMLNLPRLRSLYNSEPAWVRQYTAGLVQNLTAVQDAISTVITNLENGMVQASGVNNVLMARIDAGKPALVIMRGKNPQGQAEGHAVVAYGYATSANNVTFTVADSNYPNTPQTLTFNETTGCWSYYWTSSPYNWTNFKIGAIVPDSL